MSGSRPPRPHIRARWPYYAAALTLPVLVTVVGLVLGSRPLVAIGGFVLFLLAFALFALVEQLVRLIRWVTTPAVTSDDLAEPGLLHGFKTALALVGALPLQAAVLVRGACLALAMWIVEVHVVLCCGTFQEFIDESRTTAILSAASLLLAGIDTAKGKSIATPGIAGSILAVGGYFAFLRDYFVLGAAMGSTERFEATRAFLASPLWFLDPTTRMGILQGLLLPDALGSLAVYMLFIAAGGFFYQASRKSRNADLRSFGIALGATALWFASLPLCLLALLVLRLVI